MSKPATKQPDYDYGLPAAKLYEALRLEHRTDPDTETAAKITGTSVEFLRDHYGHLIVRLGNRLPTMTRKNALDIATGRAQPREKTETA